MAKKTQMRSSAPCTAKTRPSPSRANSSQLTWARNASFIPAGTAIPDRTAAANHQGSLMRPLLDATAGLQ
eukprot:6212490-Pleurochrysis_carterae.AAC.1